MDFNSEVNGFEKLRDIGIHPNIVRYHGCFTHGETRNVILEHADGRTLEEYFQKTRSPSSGEDIFTFWAGLLGLLGGVATIHGDKCIETEEPQAFHGYALLSPRWL